MRFPPFLLRTGLASVLAPVLATAAFARPPIQVDPDLPHYEPRPFAVPKDAGYVRPDGSIFIAGASAMKTGLANLNALFIRTHPGTRFSTEQPGSSVGPASILFHRSPFAVMDREMFPEDIMPFQMMYGMDPIRIDVGRGSYTKLDLTPPMVICVNPKNPIERLTTDEVARIFSVGGGRGDITTWGQVGLTGSWAGRAIQPMGVGRRTGEGVYMKIEHFGDRPLAARYEEHKSAELDGRVAEEVSAIAMVDLSRVPKRAKIVAISETEDGYASRAGFEDVLAGRYPYTRYTHFYVSPDFGPAFDPFVKEYLRMVLSREGQQALIDEPDGFLPLSAKEAAEQLRKLSAMSGHADVEVDPALPHYKPAAPLSGTFTAAGDDDMETLMRAWLALFHAAHPSVDFQLDVETSATAPKALAERTSQATFVGRLMVEEESDLVKKAWGYDPISAAVAGGTYADREMTHAEMVWVHPDNPIRGLTLAQLDGIFGRDLRTGSRPVRTWGDLGLTGDWAERPIHALRYKSIGAGEFFRSDVLQGGEWNPAARFLGNVRDVLPIVARDKDAIGLAGMGFRTGNAVRAVPIARSEGEPAIEPTLDAVASRSYPLSRVVYFYVDRRRGKGMAPIMTEFMRVVLSFEGQSAALQNGYLPLSAKIVAQERAKLGI